MSLDFALKDFFRNKKQTYPLLLAITLIIAISQFIIYFSNSLGFNLIFKNEYLKLRNFSNRLFFTGAINHIYSQYNTLILIMILVLAFVMVIVITTNIVISKKRDIAIMKSMGILPERLYGYYLLEVYIIFLIGFGLGLVIGIGTYWIFSAIIAPFGYAFSFQLDFLYTPILFIACIVGIFFITGYKLRKLGTSNIIQTFSKDIPYDYDASLRNTFLPRWLKKLGYNIKIAVVNTLRKRGEYRRYLILFTILMLIVFTLGLGSFVITTSSQQWVSSSQEENLIAVGHQGVLEKYEEMYRMYSDPSIFVDEEDIDFLEEEYLFNLSETEDIGKLGDVSQMDPRLISFCKMKELQGISFVTNESSQGYEIVGENREGIFPMMGVMPEKMIQDFMVEGRFFTEEDSFDNMTIGDGLAYNYFEYPLEQSLELPSQNLRFDISGIVFDTFYSGYAGYVDLTIFQEANDINEDRANILLIQTADTPTDDLKTALSEYIDTEFGSKFTFVQLDDAFSQNRFYLLNLLTYPIILLSFLGLIAVFSLFNYQKASLVQKAEDFHIMRAIGANSRSLKRILYLEAIFIIVPSILISLSFGMIFNAFFLIEQPTLPPLFVPFALAGIIGTLFIVINYFSLRPLIKKIDSFTISDFTMF
ncbi:MAG: FtsX-like permease family protein [Promethearchaeia archaeon]